MKPETKKMLDNMLNVIHNGKEFIVFDTETTGFSGYKNRLLSISALKGRMRQTENGFVFEETGKLDQFFNPEIEIPQNITNINHISNETVKDCPPERNCKNYILPFFETDSFLVGHNVSFDIRFTEAVAKRNDWQFTYCGMCDTLNVARDVLGDKVKSHKLCELTSYYHAEEGLEYHNSIDDVIATVRVLGCLLSDYLLVKDDAIVPESVKKLPDRPSVISCALWQKNGDSRVYINTKEYHGRIYYDTVSRTWKHPDNIDMEYIKKAAWEKIKTQSDCMVIYRAIKGE